MYIPDGYGTVFPYMLVGDTASFVEFLVRAFGAEVMGRTDLPGRPNANVRVRIGTSAFMVSAADGKTLKPMPGAYYVFVDDVDGTYERALAEGGTSIFAPADMPYDERQAGVADASGNLWWISKRLVERPYDD